MTNHKKLIDVTGPELPLFHKRKGKLKIDQSAKMPWLSTGIVLLMGSRYTSSAKFKHVVRQFKLSNI